MNKLKDKLQVLEKADKDLSLFGASSHEYKLGSPISINLCEEIEEKYHCTFPEDYKYFITNVGNGGAGPFYGLFPLERHDDNHDMCSWEEGYLIGDLSKPFPYSEKWNLPTSFWENEPDPDSCDSEEQEDELWEKWYQEIDTKYWAPHIMDGAIPICHQGCAIRTWLVVTGPMKGTVWDDYRCDYEGITPLKNADGSFSSFTDWYLNWVTESLNEF